MINKAKELAAEHGWYLTRQFENEANADMHTRTTAVEILNDFADTQLDYWVTGFGTGGTLKGVGRVLKKQSPATKIILCEPDNAQLLASGIAQERNDDGSPAASHPSFSPHPMQGWTPDFVPLLTEDALGLDLADRILPVNGKDALKAARDLARQEGIFAGISSGATLAGALQICAEAPEGANVLCMLPDTGERYLSTPLFDDIEVDMDADEAEISRSTPNYQFG
jgi:cysteine synthase A